MTEIADVGLKAPELLPCPFCGGEAKVKYWRGGEASGVPYSVECCDWRCPSKTRSDGSGPVIAAWNTRARQPDPRVSAPDMDQHIFVWFNERHPDEMAECIAAFKGVPTHD